MPIVTLTSDWKQNDFYVGAVKGAIMKLSPKTSVVDLNHQIFPFNISQAAFVVKNAFHFFPHGTVHLIDVSSESGDAASYLAVKHANHYFLSANNGIFGLLFANDPEIAVNIEVFSKDTVPTFAGLSVLAPAAAHLSMGSPIEELGNSVINIQKQIPLLPAIEESVISGSIVYIDSYQNAITNISRDLFEQIGKGRNFEILVQSNYYKIKRLNKHYNETSPGELLALFNSLNLLEIAINKGNAAELLNLGINATIRVKFY